MISSVKTVRGVTALSVFPLFATVTVILMIIAGNYILSTGAVVGVCMAAGVLLLISKLPRRLRRIICKNAFVADVILTSGTSYLTSHLFGTGLILGVSAVTCGVILSVLLPYITKN